MKVSILPLSFSLNVTLTFDSCNPSEADELWTSLEKSNSDLAETFATLTRLANDDGEKYGEEVSSLSGITGDQVSIRV